MSNITIRTNPEIAEKITRLAEAMERPRNWVVEDALKQYIAEQDWQIKGIKQAQQSLKDGKGVDFEDTVEKIRSRIKKHR